MGIKSIKNETKGVTLVALIITIIVLLIIAGITVYSGKDIIKKAKLEELKTNMLLIQAKAREYVEEATFQMGINPDEDKKKEVRSRVYANGSEEGAQLEEASSVPTEFGISDTSTCYWLTSETQKKWGLTKIKLESNERYLIQFNENDVTVEVYNSLGYDGIYSLTDIDKIQE